ncbi:pyruvate carboxyltransferase [Lucifera butyrica]|uniref:Pyruvate carboxyltransferase n=1 Tax=Lucifera butyrica TaxID=1351585 RepID=A0A498REZ0_9FIRM|nr:hydroxymethylglutaryl-CoA lyase [Lucifera butyrica]VBB07748.1 pyruvate carboxyltransferase [Lucifera butyrica]
MIALPKNIEFVEVGPRDGFQNIKEFIPTQTKLAVIEKMIAAGVRTMEVTSFVHPKAIPQMVDAAEVAKAIVANYQDHGLKAMALVPNLTGAKKAYECGIKEVTYVISASEKHNMANINRTREQSLADLQGITAEMPDLKIRIGVATSFGCPFLGKVDYDLVLSLIEAVVGYGVDSIILCDTIGIANPKQVSELVTAVKEKFKNIRLGLHLHDTRGMGLANTLAGLEAGVTIFETSVGGLGGCPFAPGAAGNTASEDMINMLHAMDIATGVDLDQYLEAVKIVREQIQPVLTGHMAYACKYGNV